MATKKKAAKKETVTMTVIARALNVRAKASMDAPIVKVLSNGEKVEVLDDEGEWCTVADGYVLKQWLR